MTLCGKEKLGGAVGHSAEKENYRYGFNGKENDNEISGDGNNLDFGDRFYDARLCKWFSVDKYFAKYPSHSPYVYAGNNPILFVDLDGNDFVLYLSKLNFTEEHWNLFCSIINKRFGNVLKITKSNLSEQEIETSGTQRITPGSNYARVNFEIDDAAILKKMEQENQGASADVIAKKAADFKKSITESNAYQDLKFIEGTSLKESGVYDIATTATGFGGGASWVDHKGLKLSAFIQFANDGFDFSLLYHEIVEGYLLENPKAQEYGTIKKAEFKNCRPYAFAHWAALEAQNLDQEFKHGGFILNGAEFGNYKNQFLQCYIKDPTSSTGYSLIQINYNIDDKGNVVNVQPKTKVSVNKSDYDSAKEKAKKELKAQNCPSK